MLNCIRDLIAGEPKLLVCKFNLVDLVGGSKNLVLSLVVVVDLDVLIEIRLWEYDVVIEAWLVVSLSFISDCENVCPFCINVCWTCVFVLMCMV